MFDLCWIIFAAFVLDFFFADPKWLPHPIVYMGKAISFFEPRFRRRIKNETAAGFFFALFLIPAVWLTAAVIVALCALLHPVLAGIVQTVMLFFCFSSASLEKAAMAVYDALRQNDIQAARRRVGMIVGRQTDRLDEAAVTRACVETVAENFVDGFLSPLFFALIGGAPLALAYKMVNTLDSMVGYKNKTYLFFGRTSARIDDAANFIPARLSVPVIALSAMVISLESGIKAFKTGLTEGRQHKSPNAGFPEAAFAGALGVRLGGPSVYHGALVEKPFIGKAFDNPPAAGIKQACRLMMLSSFIAVCISGVILYGFQVIAGLV